MLQTVSAVGTKKFTHCLLELEVLKYLNLLIVIKPNVGSLIAAPKRRIFCFSSTSMYLSLKAVGCKQTYILNGVPLEHGMYYKKERREKEKSEFIKVLVLDVCGCFMVTVNINNDYFLLSIKKK